MDNIVSVLSVIWELGKIFTTEQVITHGGVRAGDLLYFVGDYEKARLAFNWSPKVLPNDGLERFVKWLKNNKDVFV